MDEAIIEDPGPQPNRVFSKRPSREPDRVWLRGHFEQSENSRGLAVTELILVIAITKRCFAHTPSGFDIIGAKALE